MTLRRLSERIGGAAAYFYGADAGSILYDNTIVAPLMISPAISVLSTSTGTIVKNNIVYAGAYALVDATSETGTAFDYNDYFSASGTPFSWGGTAYSFSGWQANSSQDAHSLTANPAIAECQRADVYGELFAACGFAGD